MAITPSDPYSFTVSALGHFGDEMEKLPAGKDSSCPGLSGRQKSTQGQHKLEETDGQTPKSTATGSRI